MLEFEALVKVHYADFGNLQMLVAQLQSVRDQAAVKLQLGERLARAYLDRRVDLPQRAHVQALVWRFLWDQYRAQQAWAEWALAEVGRWPHTLPTEANLQRARQVFRTAPGIGAVPAAVTARGKGGRG